MADRERVPSQGRFDVDHSGNFKIVDGVSVLPDGRPLVGRLADLDEADRLWELFTSRHQVKDPTAVEGIIEEVITGARNVLARL